MGRDLSLAPCGLVVERVETEAEGLLILARPASATAVCPTCGSASARIHSTYRRFLADLPAQGRAVRITVYDTNDSSTTAFTPFGIECLRRFILDSRR